MNLRYPDILASLRAAYDREADDRESRAGSKTPWKVAERTAFLERIRSEDRRTILELGAGTGHDSLFFKEQGLDVVAIDLSPRMVEHCRAKGLDARVGDLLHLGFPPASFDAVYALNCLLHVPTADLGATLESIRAVMRPTALFFLGVYGGRAHEGPLENDGHVPPRLFSLRTDDELQRLVAPYFELVDFHTVPLEEDDFHFQSLTLRRMRSPAAKGVTVDVRREDWEALLAITPQLVRDALPDAPWDLDRLRALRLPVEMVPVADLRWLLDLPVWGEDGRRFQITPNDVRAAPTRYPEHWRRIVGADLSDPIHLALHRGSWAILDGFHRVIRADILGVRTLPAMRLSPDDLLAISRQDFL